MRFRRFIWKHLTQILRLFTTDKMEIELTRQIRSRRKMEEESKTKVLILARKEAVLAAFLRQGRDSYQHGRYQFR